MFASSGYPPEACRSWTRSSTRRSTRSPTPGGNGLCSTRGTPPDHLALRGLRPPSRRHGRGDRRVQAQVTVEGRPRARPRPGCSRRRVRSGRRGCPLRADGRALLRCSPRRRRSVARCLLEPVLRKDFTIDPTTGRRRRGRAGADTCRSSRPLSSTTACSRDLHTVARRLGSGGPGRGARRGRAPNAALAGRARMVGVNAATLGHFAGGSSVAERLEGGSGADVVGVAGAAIRSGRRRPPGWPMPGSTRCSSARHRASRRPGASWSERDPT